MHLDEEGSTVPHHHQVTQYYIRGWLLPVRCIFKKDNHVSAGWNVQFQLCIFFIGCPRSHRRS